MPRAVSSTTPVASSARSAERGCPSPARACGATNAPDDKFCGECGSALAAAQPARTRRRRRPQHRPRTARPNAGSSRCCSSTSSGSRRSPRVATPKTYAAMLTHYFDAASDAVQRHGGTVEKFIGDAVMAVWGTPVAHEDDAERAVRSALEIVDRVEALGALARPRPDGARRRADRRGRRRPRRRRPGLRHRRPRQHRVAAPVGGGPGTVLVGERTYRSVSESIACVPVEPLSLKGKAERVPGMAGAARHQRDGRLEPRQPPPSRPSAVATRSSGWPRSCCTPPGARDVRGCCTSRVWPASASRAWCGSCRSTSTA